MNLNKSLIGLAVMLSASVPAQAAFVFNLQEVGPDVVLSGSGTLNLAGLSLVPVGGIAACGISPSFLGAIVGSTTCTPVEVYSGFSGPTSFGSGIGTLASSGSGDTFGIVEAFAPSFLVPAGYVSGGLLSGTATFAGQTLASLGATVGTYTWTWGSGATADSMTLNVGSSITAVPEPSAYALALAGLGVLGFWGRRQKASKRQA
jgi:MYXO-CTERM domain-containing protein